MLKMVKYPYTNLKRHHSHYLKCVSVFFESLYDAWFYVTINETNIVIKIFNVNPYKIYNPMNFEPSYRVRTRGSDFFDISKYNLFNDFYKYIPDIVPYLEVELFVDHNINIATGNLELNNFRSDSCFETFNFIELYYMEETRNHFYVNTPWGE